MTGQAQLFGDELVIEPGAMVQVQIDVDPHDRRGVAIDPVGNRLGCGVRQLVIVTVGSVWIHLIDPCTLKQAKIDKLTFDRMRPRPVPVSPERRRRLLRRSYRTNARHGLTQPRQVVLNLVRRLGGQQL